ncbi:MAG: hypothetical protein Q8O88_03655 [bacterium]|nr:hypothetical protein [bacterium]
MKKHTNNKPVSKKLDKKKVEDIALTYHQGGIANADVEFGEVEVKFSKRPLFQRGLNFREFIIGGIRYTLAAKDEKHLTITYLFH